jgi:GAF domain-containing protein
MPMAWLRAARSLVAPKREVSVQSGARIRGSGNSDRVAAQCRLIAEHARLVTGAARANLVLYDEPSGQLVTVATTASEIPLQQVAVDLIRRNYPGLDMFQLSYPPSVNKAVASAFIGQRTQVNEMAEAFENIYPPAVAAIARGVVGVTCVVSCPVTAEGRALGLIRFLISGPPNDQQQALMEAAANQIGLILANAHFAEQTTRQLAAARAMAEVGQIGLGGDIRGMLQALVDRAQELTAADVVRLYLVDPGADTFRPSAESLSPAGREHNLGRMSSPVREIGSGLVGWVIASGEPAFVPDVRLDPRTRSQRLSQLREAVIAVPMRLPDRIIGCLNFSLMRGRRFIESDLWVAQTMADQAAMAVQGAHLHDRGRAGAYDDGFRHGATATTNETQRSLEELLDAAEDESDPGAEQLRRALKAARRASLQVSARLDGHHDVGKNGDGEALQGRLW